MEFCVQAKNPNSNPKPQSFNACLTIIFYLLALYCAELQASVLVLLFLYIFHDHEEENKKFGFDLQAI